MRSILSTVTEAEAKVVGAVRNLQEPVVGYVRKGVDLADRRLSDIRSTGGLARLANLGELPTPGEVVGSQVEFVKSLLDAQRDLVKAVVRSVAPRDADATPAGPVPATKGRKAARAAKTPTTST